jgi:colanic acid/amylovoran biosynthesis glycosyltransferase
MSRPLAVFAPLVGGLSETFIRRHMEALLPGGTVVVADSDQRPYGGYWSVDCPVLYLHQPPRKGRLRRLADGISKRFGRGDGDGGVRVNRFLEDNGVRVVLGEYLDWSLKWIEMLRRAGIRFFGHAHGYDVSMQLRDPRWRADYLKYDRSDGVITMSEFSKNRLAALGLERDRIHVVPYGIDVPPNAARRLPGAEVKCLAVGRMVAKKAPILTLDAFRRAALECPELVLDYVGDGELLPAARQFVQAFGLQRRVRLHGGRSQEEVQRFMRDADIFLQHSVTDPDSGDEEGLPVAILEAMACGLPVVSTRTAGIPEAVTDGENGFLVEAGDSAEMGARLATLAKDVELRLEIGAAAWRRADRDYRWERERDDLLRILGLSRAAAAAPRTG